MTTTRINWALTFHNLDSDDERIAEGVIDAFLADCGKTADEIAAEGDDIEIPTLVAASMAAAAEVGKTWANPDAVHIEIDLD